jgi:Holliday junction resolvase RusA-like endonuclease
MSYSKQELAEILNNPDIKIDTTGLIPSPKALTGSTDGIKAARCKSTHTDKIKPVQCVNIQKPKRGTVIRMSYPGNYITENHAYNRNGRQTFMKPEAREWQDELILRIKTCGIADWQEPLKVKIEGVFTNRRECIDVHNLKIVFDAVEKGTGINDKRMQTETIPGIIDTGQAPAIIVTITEM